MKFTNYNGLLSENGFKIGIEALSTYYMSFKFWQEDFKEQVELRKKLWYDFLKHISDDEFDLLITDYCKNNVYPPQSPTHLLQHYNALIDLEVEKTYQEIIRLIDKHDKIEMVDNERRMITDWESVINEATNYAKRVIIAYKERLIKNYDKDTIKDFLSVKTPQISLWE